MATTCQARAFPAGATITGTDPVHFTATMSAPATGTVLGATVTPGVQMSFPTDGYLWVDIQPGIPGDIGLTDPTQAILGTAGMIRPSVAALGSLCRSRTGTLGSGGQETGVFSDATRPTAVEAEELISNAVTHVLTAVGFSMPEWTYSQAKQMALFWAARLVEATFDPLAVAKGDSAYAAYTDLFNETRDAVKAAVENEVGGAPHQGVYSLPVMTRRQMRVKEFPDLARHHDLRRLPDDLRYPMGRQRDSLGYPGNSEEWEFFPWAALMDYSAWQEVDGRFSHTKPVCEGQEARP